MIININVYAETLAEAKKSSIHLFRTMSGGRYISEKNDWLIVLSDPPLSAFLITKKELECGQWRKCNNQYCLTLPIRHINAKTYVYLTGKVSFSITRG